MPSSPRPAAPKPAPKPDRPDPLAPLLELKGIERGVHNAAQAISAVHRHRVNLRKWNITGSESVLRGARASAWLDGADPTIPDDGIVNDPVLAAALRVAELLAPDTIGETTRTWKRAPLQVLARMAALASPTGANAHPDDEAGRPVGDARLSAAMKEQRLHILSDLITGGTDVPAAVLSGVVHGEVLTLAPFAHNNGIIARAASRLVTVSNGLDPRGLGVPESRWSKKRTSYVEASRQFAAGTEEGVRTWMLLHLEGLEAGAAEARSIAEAV
ncbi:hypothetical protein KRX51_00945 [Corynebacterium sp. TAE3-ERU12]|nr:hypothetical protein [Corynebacterium sp. TAE3-ERU12]MBV7294485.1 hypothetical protein [Corynebacterium sp. TAE3-ERU12]